MTNDSTQERGFRRMRRGGDGIGYWVVLDSPITTERIASLGYDWIVLDDQHGDLGLSGVTNGMQAAGAAGVSCFVRVSENNLAQIGRALDRGAAGVIVPLVNSAEDARQAVRACLYPPLGSRSFGPLRAHPAGGATVEERNAVVKCVVMIETPQALENLEEIASAPGVSGLYIGPSDLMIALGGAEPGDPAYADAFESALTRIRETAHAAGVTVGMHVPDGAVGAQRLAEGFDYISIASDLSHLTAAATDHLKLARGASA